MKGKGTDETLLEAKRRRAIADANRAEIMAQKEADQVVSREVVDAAMAEVGAEFRARLLSLRGSLVTELFGRTEPQIYRALDDAFCGILEDIFTRKPIPKIT